MGCVLAMLVLLWTAPPAGNSLGVRVVDAAGGGAQVTAVYARSPAAAAGLRLRDVVVRYGGQEVAGAIALERMSLASEPGAVVELAVRRKGHRLQVRVHLAAGTPRRIWPNYPPGVPGVKPRGGGGQEIS